jgi:hypothetical protein
MQQHIVKEEFNISLCPVLNAYSHEKPVIWESAFW